MRYMHGGWVRCLQKGGKAGMVVHVMLLVLACERAYVQLVYI